MAENGSCAQHQTFIVRKGTYRHLIADTPLDRDIQMIDYLSSENGLVFQSSLCLSRACLGKRIILSTKKWKRETVVAYSAADWVGHGAIPPCKDLLRPGTVGSAVWIRWEHRPSSPAAG